MSGIFGIFRRDGHPAALSTMVAMRRAMASWGPDGGDMWLDGCAGLGQVRLHSTPEARYERLPYVDTAGGFVFTAAARLDNRDELLADVGCSAEDATVISDGDLLRQAYLRWGADCVKRVYGDWSFAAYHPAEHRLFLARDHFGYTALYYYADPHIFAFASSQQALLDLKLAPRVMDELYVAQVLVSWTAYHGERTVYKTIKRLPPAHYLTVTPERQDTYCYWYLENTPELRLPRREDYVDAFREVFDEAVKTRLRTPSMLADGGAGQLAVSMSGGLDSGSVAVTAARFLRPSGGRLTAFTAVPLVDTSVYTVVQRFGDELPYAQATARQAGNIDMYAINAAGVSPIRAIRRMLHIQNEPAHAPGNFFWTMEVMKSARDRGCRVLLTGQRGNAGISWTGDVWSQPLIFQLQHLGWRKWSKEVVKRYLPAAVLQSYRHLRLYRDEGWQSSAIHPDFARRMDLRARMLCAADAGLAPPYSPREQRCLILKPGKSLGGARKAENSAAFGLEVRDPTADVRVLAFTFSVPDRIFIDPETGLDRWLIRAAMRDHLPDQVRLNRRRGLQAADLAPRLRACAAEVEEALDELARGPAAEYVHVAHMRRAWRVIQTQDIPEVYIKAVSILTRGIMAGLFVNGFFSEQ